MRRLAWLLVLLLLLSGCGEGRSAEPVPQSEPAPAPAPTPLTPPPSDEPPPSSRLLPQADGVYTFLLQDGYDGETRAIKEEWVRDGNRLVATQGGRPYVTWLLAADGVWRTDPKNPKVLLRFLPPELKEMAWRQRSGDDWVWFRLRPALRLGAWVLTVQNRGERIDWEFRDGRHEVAAETASRPEAAFWKRGGGRSDAPVATERRAAILAAAPLLPTERAPLEEVGHDRFLSALNELGYDSQPVDFDGDGVAENLAGAFGKRTWFAPELTGEEGEVIGTASYYDGAATFSLVTLGGRPRLLVHGAWRRGALQIVWFEAKGGEWQSRSAMEIGPKMIGWTPATRSQLLPDGRLRVEWEPEDDPAGHRQVRHLRLSEEGQVEWLDESWEPRAEKLRQPQTPQELLQAFFFTQWFGLQEEAKLYLARPEMADAFPVERQPRAFTTEGWVEIGQIDANCWKTTQAEVPATGPIPFVATISWYEGGQVQSGTAEVGRAPDGRLVLESIEISQSCFNY